MTFISLRSLIDRGVVVIGPAASDLTVGDLRTLICHCSNKSGRHACDTDAEFIADLCTKGSTQVHNSSIEPDAKGSER